MRVGTEPIAPLLEREAQLRAVDELLAKAQDGRGGVLLFEGAAGLGKSSLLHAGVAAAAARELRPLTARSSELERPLSFGVVRQLLEATVRRGGEAGELTGPGRSAAPLLGVAAGPTPADELELHHALFWIAADLAEQRPLLLCVDDLHWADAPSLRFLGYLAQRLADLPIAVLGALRPREPGADEALLARLAASPATTAMALGPLTAGATERVVRARFERADAGFAEAAHRASGGNPFYLHELLRAFAAEGDDPSAEAGRRIARLVPDSVLRTAVLRLSTLPPGSRDLARAAAILGDDALLARTAELASLPIEVAAAAADALVAADLLRGGEPLAFPHPLLRATLEEDIPEVERRLARRRAAALLHADGAPAERVAAQLLDAPRAGDPWVAARLREAAADARSRVAADSAMRYLRRALQEPPPRAELPAVLIDLAEAEALVGDPQAIGHLERAIELLPDVDARRQALLRLGWQLYETGRHVDALAALQRGLDERPGARDALAAELKTGRLAIATLVGSISVAELERRVDGRQDLAAGHAGRELATQLALAHVMGSRSHEQARAYAHRALDGGRMLEEDGVSLSFSIAVSCLFWADDLDGADRAIADALRVARERASPATAAYVLFGRAQVRWYQGRVHDAAADAGAAVDAWRGGFGMHLPAAAHWQALALLELGDVDAAEAALRSGWIEQHDAFGRGHLLLATVRLAAARGDAERRLRVARELAALAARTPFYAGPATFPWRSEAALAELRTGSVDTARTLVEEELELARRFGAPRPIAVALRTAAIVDGGDRAIDLARASVTAVEDSGHRLELARSLLTLGTLLRSRGARVDAREPLRRALDLARTLGLREVRRRAREELVAAGGRPRREALTGLDALTPSERRVAELAAAGLSNPEIAQELFVTRKTVEFHLRRAYRKLAIASRRDLPRALEGTADLWSR